MSKRRNGAVRVSRPGALRQIDEIQADFDERLGVKVTRVALVERAIDMFHTALREQREGAAGGTEAGAGDRAGA